MKTGEGAAILLALRRGSGNLYYPGTDRSFWVPMADVRAIPREAVPEGSLEALLSGLLLFLDAEECVIDEGGAGAMRLTIDHAGSTRAQLRELETTLGARLEDYAYEPASMRCARLRLSLVSLPTAAGDGR
jgi:hypothetical protein